MSNELATTNTVDPFAALAAIGATEGKSSILKFAKGQWLVGETEMNNVAMTADVANLAVGWRKWVDGRMVDSDMGIVALGFTAKDRGELDDQERSSWPLNKPGERSDPWQFCYMLHLSDEDGNNYTFPAVSWGARRAIGWRRHTPSGGATRS